MNTFEFMLGIAIANAPKENVIEHADGSIQVTWRGDNEKNEEEVENSLKLHQEIIQLFQKYETQEITGALTIALKDNMNKFYYELVTNNNQSNEKAKQNVELLLETIKETVIEHLKGE